MKSARRLVTVTILMSILTALSIISCGGVESLRLDGTWELSTITEVGNDVWNGTYTINYVTEFEISGITTEFYSGDIVWNDVPFKISVEKKTGVESGDYNYFLYLFKTGDKKSENSIKMVGFLENYSSISGNYYGIGTYDPDYGSALPGPPTYGGSFITNRQ